MKRFKILMVAVAPMVIWFPSVACAFSITKIADTNTPVPGGTGTFTRFDLTSGGAFIADGSLGQEGIYTFALLPLANTTTSASGFEPGVKFAGFSALSFGGAGASFIATTTTGQQAVYDEWFDVTNGDMGRLLIARTGQSPSAGATFNNFTNVSSTYNLYLNPTGEFLSDAGIYFFSVKLAEGAGQLPPYPGYAVSFN